MKFGGLRDLGARWGGRVPGIRAIRSYLIVFIVLFLVFFVINQQLLTLPDRLRRMLGALPLEYVAYSDMTVHIFPPELEIKDVALVAPRRGEVLLRLETLMIRPELWQLLSGKAVLRATARSGEGSATLDVATGGSFDVSAIAVTLRVQNMPLHILGPLERFDPDIEGALSALVTGAIGLPLSRQCDLTVNGRVTLASARNAVSELTVERFRNGAIDFDIAVSGSEAAIRRVTFSDEACSAVLGGTARINWRNPPSSQVDLSGEVKARPQDVAPALLMDARARQRLELGQFLPLAIKGTVSDARITPGL